jgi:peptidoglycan glycosyltransferase
VTSGVGLEAPQLVPNSPSPPGPPYQLTVDSPKYPDVRKTDLPQSNRELHNFGDSQCGGTLAQSFRVSCNTTFAQIGLDLGETFASGIERFGVSTARRHRPPARRGAQHRTRGRLVQVQPTELRAVGDRSGKRRRDAARDGDGRAVGRERRRDDDRDLDHVENNDGEKVPGTTFKPHAYQTSMQPQTAATVRDLMIDVVNNGTGTHAQIPGVQVAGKTGTAQVQGKQAHAWFIGFAPAAAPQYAIAVLVENGGNSSGGDNATGGRVAAPIAAQVLGGLLSK